MHSIARPLVCALALAPLARLAPAQVTHFELVGPAPSDLFGTHIESIGDVDGDGTPDFGVVSNNEPGFPLGLGRVYSGATRAVLHTIEPLYPEGRLTRFAGMGDLDGDGLADFATGDSDGNGPPTGGAVHLWSGASGALLRTIPGPPNVGVFGTRFTSIQDLDGDGQRDILIRTRATASPNEYAIRAYSSGTGLGLYTLPSPDDDSSFARSIVVLGDVDGDGAADLATAEPNFNGASGSQGDGRILIFSGADRTILHEIAADPLAQACAVDMARAGDIDGDGVEDLLVGSFLATGGVVRVISGANGQEFQRVEAPQDAVGFGGPVSFLGDANGDGTPDILVGAPNDQSQFQSGGAVFVYAGLTGQLLLEAYGQDPFARAGSSLAGIGDIDGDGLTDVLFGAPSAVQIGITGRVLGVGVGTEPVLLDFELQDDFATPLANGQRVDDGLAFGSLVRVSAAGPQNFGVSVFDSTPSGPNQGGPSADLLVDRGNLLLLQASPAQVAPGVFATPSAAPAGGRLQIDLLSPGTFTSIDLAGLGAAGGPASVRLIDQSGRTRTYSVPAGFTADGAIDPANAVQTLDLTTLQPQQGVSATASATENAGFAPGLAVTLEIDLASTGAIDRLRFQPSGLPEIAPFEPVLTFFDPDLNNSYGEVARGVGDIDGDGITELLLSQVSQPNPLPGIARLYSGATGAELAAFEGERASHFFSNDLCGLGDVDGDGTPDFAIAASSYDLPAETNVGAVTVFSGATGGELWRILGTQGDNLGISIDSLGDVNGDGIEDLVAGADGAGPSTGGSPGRIQVHSGLDGALLYSIAGQAPGDQLGVDARAGGDIDGDGITDILAYSNGTANAGRLQAFSGLDGSILFELTGTVPGAFFGSDSGPAGDVDQDGLDDILLPRRATNGSGTLQVLSGQDGSVIHEVRGGVPGAPGAAIVFPVEPASLGDLDGDGVPDFSAIDRFDPPGPEDAASRLRIYSGHSAEILYEDTLFGLDLFVWAEPLGDVDEDGLPEFLVRRRFSVTDFRVDVMGLLRPNGSPVCPGGINSTGRGARLFTNGAFAALQNGLELTANDVPTTGFALLFSSPAFGLPAQLGAQGTGNFCLLGGPALRHGLSPIAADATASFAVDLTILPEAAAGLSSLSGQTQLFQAAFRDSGPTGLINFTDAIRLHFE